MSAGVCKKTEVEIISTKKEIGGIPFLFSAPFSAEEGFLFCKETREFFDQMFSFDFPTQ
jgi:hypothetical protein